MDYWGGTFGLSILALIELIMFGWIWGMKKGWKEINEGADIKIPYIFKFIIKYVTPAYLLGIFGFWAFSKNGALAILLMDVDPNGNPVNPENVPYIWFARGLLVFILVMYILLIKIAWKKNKHQYPEEFNMEGKNNV